MKTGGSYRVDENGNVHLIEKTVDHVDGNRARNAKGKPLDVMAKPLKTVIKGVNHGAEISKENPASKD